MTKYIVERGIPAPGVTPKSEGKRGRGRPVIFPFGSLSVGDSFFVPSCDATSDHVSSLASQHGKKFGKKFTTRSTTNGIRCWRIAKVTKK